MTKEEKDLLLKVLCAMLPHGVRVCYKIHLEDEPIDVTLSGLLLDYFNNKTVVEIKPYLRPMSSMTEEEREEFLETCIYSRSELCYLWQLDSYDWLNAHLFDYRGLIEKGLALETPKRMYN